MKTISDFAQILLTLPGVSFVGCMILVCLIWQALKLASGALSALKWVIVSAVPYIVPVWRPGVLGWIAVVSLIIWPCRNDLHDMLQGLEYHMEPVYVTDAGLSPAGQMEAYETILRRHITPEQLDTLKTWTAYTAERINSTPLAIYEAALLECGLKPFNVRDDEIAAGWIQFTNKGCASRTFSKADVIRACRRKDITFIMRCTDEYLFAKWVGAGRPNMRNTIDLYLAIFAPAHIGKGSGQVVYTGFGNNAYYKNRWLDGHYMEPSGLIVRKDGCVDGRITVWEIYLALTRKKALLMKQKN